MNVANKPDKKECETKDSSLRINIVLEPRDQRLQGLSLSRSVGRVGVNPGNEVVKSQNICFGSLNTFSSKQARLECV